MSHKVMCCRRQGSTQPIEWIEIDYSENICSGKIGCKADCGFTSVNNQEVRTP